MDRIGETFKRGGNTLTIIDKVKVKRWVYHYILECNICSKDEELWPYGSIRSWNYSTLIKGHTPCGCGSSTKWKDWQVDTLVKRRCNLKGYIFKGFKSKFKGIATKVIIYNPSTNNTWDTKSAFDFLNRSDEDPSVAVGGLKTDYNLLVSKVPESKVVCFESCSKEYIFKCNTCFNDEYSSSCSSANLFKIRLSNIYRFRYTCRCSKGYLWTQKEREYQINKRLTDLEGVFLGWCDNAYSKSSDRFKWGCCCGYLNTTSVNCFINKGVGCYSCNVLINAFNGYYPKRKDDKDYLYIIKVNKNIFKIGRTFYLNNRLNSIISESKIKNLEYYKIYTGVHEEVWNIEQKIIKTLDDCGLRTPRFWSTELFDISALSTAIGMLGNECLELKEP